MLVRASAAILIVVGLSLGSCLRDYEDYGYSESVGSGAGAAGEPEDLCENDGDCPGPSVCQAGQCTN
jgi:hypothetical protein